MCPFLQISFSNKFFFFYRDTPQKKSLLTAATQAYVGESDDETGDEEVSMKFILLMNVIIVRNKEFLPQLSINIILLINVIIVRNKEFHFPSTEHLLYPAHKCYNSQKQRVSSELN